MLAAIKEALHEAIATDQVKKVLQISSKKSLSALDAMKALDLSHRPTFSVFISQFYAL